VRWKALVTCLSKIIKLSIPLLILLIFASSCSIRKNIPPDEYLMHQHKIKNEPRAFREELKGLARPTLNRRLAGLVRARMWIYFWTDNEKEKGFASFLRRNLGEPPVLLDTNLVQTSARQMEQFLFNKGFFDAQVEHEIILQGKKATATYELKPGDPYLIDEIEYYIQDRIIDSLVMTDTSNSYLERGKRYDMQTLREERERITFFLRNNGFYNLTRDFIYFDVDTSAGRSIRLGVGIAGRPDFQRHKTYFIDTIYVEPDFRMFEEKIKDTSRVNGYSFLANEFKVLPGVLKDFIFIKPGEIYKTEDVRKSLEKITNLRIFRFVDIQFREKEIPGVQDTALLEAYIRLTPFKRFESIFDVELKTTEGGGATAISTEEIFGISGSVSFRNKNLFKRAIQQELRLRGGLEYLNESKIFNYRAGASASTQLPRAFIPWKFRGEVLGDVSNTFFDFSFFYEENIDYERTTSKFQYYYNIQQNQWRHILAPVDFALVNTIILNDTLNLINNPFIRNQFSTHIIPAARYSFVYLTQDQRLNRSYWQIRGVPVETSGLLFYLYSILTGAEESPSTINKYGVFGVDFYQYIKTQLDFRYHHILSPGQRFVYRANAGFGLPYGNSISLPFEKQFIIGGANSLRGWRIGEVGPGSFNDTLFQRFTFNHTGDILLELNAEYRFDLSKIWKAAVFTDAGNIWTRDESVPIRPGGELNRFTDLYNDLAISTGAGIRWDFGFFVFRSDIGLKLRDPRMPLGEKWIIRNYKEEKFDLLNLNFGIGYPF
jgi:hypothetical protein